MPEPEEEDWSLAVGIEGYPGLDGEVKLRGCRAEAHEFHRWAISRATQGGKVPIHQARLIRSPRTQEPSHVNAKPTLEALQVELSEFEKKSDERLKRHGTSRVGRRLYLYFAGHGFAFSEKESAYLAANSLRYRGHLVCEPVVDWLLNARMFDEIVLFLNCCREHITTLIPNRFPPEAAPAFLYDPTMTRRAFIGLPTQFGATTWTIADPRAHPKRRPRMRSVFFLALVRGLEGGASDARTVRYDATRGYCAHVTAESLKTFLETKCNVLYESARNGEWIHDRPQCAFRDPHGQLSLGTVPFPHRRVRVKVSDDVVGDTLQIERRDDRQVLQSLVITKLEFDLTVPNCDVVLHLVRGGRTYLVEYPPLSGSTDVFLL